MTISPVLSRKITFAALAGAAMVVAIHVTGYETPETRGASNNFENTKVG